MHSEHYFIHINVYNEVMDNNIRDFGQYKRRTKRKTSVNSYGKLKPKKKLHIPIMTVLFALIIIIGISYGYLQVLNDNDENTKIPISVLSDVTGKLIQYDSAKNPPMMDDIYVLYSSLNDADKCVYDMFFDLVNNRNNEGYKSAVVISTDSLSQIGNNHFWDIYYAMCYDHPEFFYLLTEPSRIDAYTVTEDDYVTYLYNMEDASIDENTLVSRFESAANEFLNDIDLDASDEEIELAIHDKLIDTVTYDYEILEATLSENAEWDLGNTAYGALVADSDGRSNHAVCSGYAFAFQYLLQKAGIPCAYVSGSANTIPASERDQDNHAWNVVKIGNKWYEVDATWDDSESEEGEEVFTMLQEDEEKYYNLCHHYYNKTTAEMNYLPATDDTLFEIEGYQPYNAVYDTTHIRSENEEDKFLNSLVPIAE